MRPLACSIGRHGRPRQSGYARAFGGRDCCPRRRPRRIHAEKVTSPASRAGGPRRRPCAVLNLQVLQSLHMCKETWDPRVRRRTLLLHWINESYRKTGKVCTLPCPAFVDSIQFDPPMLDAFTIIGATVSNIGAPYVNHTTFQLISSRHPKQ
jgi:hypothetical protein